MGRQPLIDQRLRKSWGKRVHRRRKNDLRMTQIDLAVASDLSQSIISKIEAGDYAALNIRQMLSIAAALECQVEDLFDWTPGLADARRRELARSAA